MRYRLLACILTLLVLIGVWNIMSEWLAASPQQDNERYSSYSAFAPAPETPTPTPTPSPTPRPPTSGGGNGSSCIGIMIPAYYGPGPAMDKTIAAAGPVVYMIANADSGPGTATNAAWKAAIDRAKAAGIGVLGYVATDHGNVSEASVKAQVDAWKKLYGVTDIMFDETWVGDTSKVTYYQDLKNYVHQQTPGSIVRDNAGDTEPEAYMQTADILGIFEGSYAQYLNWHPASWIHKYPARRFYEEMYSVPNPSVIPNIFTLLQKYNAGYMMLTDSNNPWNQFSSDTFWNAFTSEVKTDCR
jgi:hypothetical protein